MALYGGFVQIISGVNIVTTPVVVQAHDIPSAQLAIRHRAHVLAEAEDRIEVSLTAFDIDPDSCDATDVPCQHVSGGDSC